MAGGALSAIGVVGLKKAGGSSSKAIAAIPIMFGVQQLVEGVLWLSLGYSRIQSVATLAFLLFAYVFWPVYLPYAVWKDETNQRRRKVLSWFIWFGTAVSLYLLYFILRGPVSSVLMGHGIAYNVPLPNHAVIPGAYVLATCGSCLVSSHKFIRVFGMALVASLVVAYAYYSVAFVSVWCFFAAILSLIILVHLFRTRKA